MGSEVGQSVGRYLKGCYLKGQLLRGSKHLPAAPWSLPLSLLLQDEELLGHVQNAILQVQGNCEKLNITTSNLIEDHRQKQKDIDVGPKGGRVGRLAPDQPCR